MGRTKNENKYRLKIIAERGYSKEEQKALDDIMTQSPLLTFKELHEIFHSRYTPVPFSIQLIEKHKTKRKPKNFVDALYAATENIKEATDAIRYMTEQIPTLCETYEAMVQLFRQHEGSRSLSSELDEIYSLLSIEGDD